MAILDLDREVVRLKSSKGFSLHKILEFLEEECTPMVIASDVFPAPKLLGKVAAAFSARLHEPAESLSRRTKSRLVRAFDLSERERHKKDALAAAVSAYESISPMLKKIEIRFLRHGISDKLETSEVAGKIISGECKNIDSAIKSLVREEKSDDVAL